MAVREFDGAADYIDLDPGTELDVTTAFTIVMVFKSRVHHAGGLYCAMEPGTVACYGINPFSDGNLYVSGFGFAGAAYTAGEWLVVAWSKAAGTANARFHVYSLDNPAGWSHAADDAVSDQNVFGVDRIRVGRWRANAEYFDGRLAVLACFESALSDVTIETFSAGLPEILDAGPAGAWRFDQADVGTDVLDLAENGADQIAIAGTNVVTDDDPPGFIFDAEEPEPEPEPEPSSHTDLWEWMWHMEREGAF